MLTRYSESNRKVTMGILSFMNGLSNMDLVNKTIDIFSKNDNKLIYLQKSNDQFIGVALVIVDDNCVILDRMAFIPNENTVYNQNDILRSLQSIYPHKRLMGSLKTASILERFEMSQNHEE